MSKEFMLPELGENIEAADVLHILIKKGDFIENDQPVLEIETDKATIEVPTNFAGRVKEVYVKEGEKVKVGQVVFSFEDDSEEPLQKAQEASANVRVPLTIASENSVAEVLLQPTSDSVIVQTESKLLEMKLPDLGENIASADVTKVLVKVGDILKNDDSVLEIETDKATIEVPSSVAGVITEIFVKDGQKAAVGQVVLKVMSQTVAVKVKKIEVSNPVTVVPVKTAETSVVGTEVSPAQSARFTPVDSQPGILANPAPAAPSVRRLARELGVDINNVKGSGEFSRISLDDVKLYVKNLNLEAKASGGGFGIGIKAEALPDFSKFGSIERQAMSNIRAKTADHLSYAWATIPHVTQFDKADITELENLRKYFSPRVEAKGGKLTVTAILIKVIAAALKQFPQFNASVDMATKEIVFKKYFNIGVAVDTERGLIVPVINNADTKNVTDIALDLQVISEKARTRKISPEDLQGGCFTISNLGGIGGTYFTPIVNAPEVAILGVSRGSFEPVYKNGNFIPRLMLPLSLSYDHRVIDGADAIRFLRWVIEGLEQPMKLLIEG